MRSSRSRPLQIAAVLLLAALVALALASRRETVPDSTFAPVEPSQAQRLRAAVGVPAERDCCATQALACDRASRSGVPNGRSVMVVTMSTPRAAREAVQGWEGARWERVAPAGTAVTDALGGLFAGLMPIGADLSLFAAPPDMLGLAEVLRPHGYETFAAAGVELTFGNRRAMLRRLGFEQFVEPAFDETGFDVVNETIARWDALRTTGRPAFAFVHAPQPQGLWQWYREHARDDTYLVLTALRAEPEEGDWFALVFVAGPGVEPGSSDTRLAAHADIAATLRELLGLGAGPCDVGTSLLGPPPRARTVATIDRAGERVRVHRAEHAWDVPGPAVPPDIAAFADTLQDVTTALARTNALAPPTPPTGAAIWPLSPPIAYAHRGNIAGPRPDTEGNRPADFEAAVQAGFAGLEIDVVMTADDELVVMHDAGVMDDGRPRPVRELTWAELRAMPGHTDVARLEEVLSTFGPRATLLLDLKPMGDPAFDRRFAERVTAALVRSAQQLRVQSFSPWIAAFVARHCARCEVGWLTPLHAPYRPQVLDAALVHELDFVAIRHDLLPPEAVTALREQGVRVFVYGLNDAAELSRFAGALPDAVITDSAALLGALH